MSLECCSPIGGVIESRFTIASIPFRYRSNIALMSLQCPQMSLERSFENGLKRRFNIASISLNVVSMSLKCRLNVAPQIGGVIESRFNIALTSFQYRFNIALMSLQCRVNVA